jgi:hypothetical protein
MSHRQALKDIPDLSQVLLQKSNIKTYLKLAENAVPVHTRPIPFK